MTFDERREEILAILQDRSLAYDAAIEKVTAGLPLGADIIALSASSIGRNGAGTMFYAMVHQYEQEAEARAADETQFVPDAEVIE